MKKRMQKILTTAVTLVLLLLSACGKSHHNALIYQYRAEEGAPELDSLKKEILSDHGITMLVSYADSDVVIIHYDRFKTHQQRIESRFTEKGYAIRLLEKHAVNSGEQSWGRR